MALPEEQAVMAAIGLGQHYNWYNGSGSCREVRHHAAERLAGALSEAGYVVNAALIELVKQVAYGGEESEYVLTKTWECASDVIQLSIHAANGMSPEAFVTVEAAIRGLYEPRQRVSAYGEVRYVR